MLAIKVEFDIAISYQILSKKPPALGDNFYGATV